MSKTVKLNNGLEIPIIGLGTYKAKLGGEVKNAVKYAIDVGYRHIDCAWFYENEEEIGEAIQEKIQEGAVKREELFVTTKLWNNFHAKDKVQPMLEESLKKLRLDYVDLFLIHHPTGFKEDAPLPPPAEDTSRYYSDVDYLETWEGMEVCVNSGLAKSIGLSNFNSEQVERVLKNSKIRPVVNQVEVNPNLNQKPLIEFCEQREIVVVGYSPLGRTGDLRADQPTPTVLDPNVKAMATKYNKSAPQIILNYLLTLGIVIIPKSVTESRILENLNIFDFELEPADVSYLDSCNKNLRVVPNTAYIDHKYFPFNIEF